MFTGIIKAAGEIISVAREGTNVHFTIASPISAETSVDQSVAHDGVCLTVTHCNETTHTVTAIQETLDRTTLGDWREGTVINLEFAMQAGARLDGHMVQGHIDCTAECTHIDDVGGSWNFRFRFEPHEDRVLVDKGSICVSGVSLTVVKPTRDGFGVSIIPYTYEHTGFRRLRVGDEVNLEFDVIGKYVVQYARLYGGK